MMRLMALSLNRDKLHPVPVWLALLLTFSPIACHAVTPSSGCDTEGWTNGTYTIKFEDLSRAFRLFVPKGYDPNTPAPMVVVYHGWNGDENEFLNHEAVRQEADQRGYIVVAPRGLGSSVEGKDPNSWTFSGSATGVDGEGDKICDDRSTPDNSYAACEAVHQNACAWTQCLQDDVAFSIALVEHVENNLCVDEDHVFAAGGSNGGMFAWELGQNPVSAETFKAIASLIGLPHRAYLQPQGKAGDLPALVITGTRDAVVPPGQWENPNFTTTSNDTDRYFYTGATAITRSWAQAHDCGIDRAAVAFDTGVNQIDCRTYCSGDSGWPRVLDCRAPMGHEYQLEWSWGLMLEFFEQHSVSGR